MLKRRHLERGLTEEAYAEMVIAQEARCAICRTIALTLVVDHDHQTGRIRGLLCTACNVGIGNLGDDPDRLEAARLYLLGGTPSQP
jgi:hypothetical protein